jgi:phenylalanyl-tRNA synthetase alpha chain
MKDQLEKLKKEVLAQLNSVKDVQVLRDLEIKYLGRKGKLTDILRKLADLSVQQRKEIGQLANDIKLELADRFRETADMLSGAKKSQLVDATLPGEPIKRGHLHPVTIIQNELEYLLSSMGFYGAGWSGLNRIIIILRHNIPPHHPSVCRILFMLIKNKQGAYDMVLRTHTSSVQVRAMQKYGAPLRCVVPGRCFRSEATDVRHEHTFYQLEGFVIDKNISLCDMKGVLETVAKRLYGEETKLRLRPKFYPFVEPGNNGEVTCFLCHGKGWVCKKLARNCRLVHPNVLKAGESSLPSVLV